jgi:hypothetical protein
VYESDVNHFFEPHANGCQIKFNREIVNKPKSALKRISKNDVDLYYKGNLLLILNLYLT